MSASIPNTVAHFDHDVVVETLSRHAVNVSDAAGELGVAKRRFAQAFLR